MWCNSFVCILHFHPCGDRWMNSFTRLQRVSGFTTRAFCWSLLRLHFHLLFFSCYKSADCSVLFAFLFLFFWGFFFSFASFAVDFVNFHLFFSFVSPLPTFVVVPLAILHWRRPVRTGKNGCSARMLHFLFCSISLTRQASFAHKQYQTGMLPCGWICWEILILYQLRLLFACNSSQLCYHVCILSLSLSSCAFWCHKWMVSPFLVQFA